jgi:hypothetical protein
VQCNCSAYTVRDGLLTIGIYFRIYEEEDILAAVDARTESLQNLRELGPPDLVYLIKQPKTGSTRQVSTSSIYLII